ncbi:MAG: hypothetical protein ACI97A_000127 [Planctomycetota bacterium]|jgi:hypothetical protein
MTAVLSRMQKKVLGFALIMVLLFSTWPYILGFVFQLLSPTEISCEAETTDEMIEQLAKATRALRREVGEFCREHQRIPLASEIDLELLDTTCGPFHIESGHASEFCVTIGNYAAEGTYTWTCRVSDPEGKWHFDT